MKNYKLLMMATIFSLASSLDAMPPKKNHGSHNSPVRQQAAAAVPSEELAPVIVDNLQDMKKITGRLKELEDQVPQLVGWVDNARKVALAQNALRKTAEDDMGKLRAAHETAVAEKETRIAELSGQIEALTRDAERTGGESAAAIQGLRAEKDALVAEKDAELKKRTDLEKGLAKFRVTDEELQRHEESRKSVKALLDGTAGFLAAFEA